MKESYEKFYIRGFFLKIFGRTKKLMWWASQAVLKTTWRRCGQVVDRSRELWYLRTNYEQLIIVSNCSPKKKLPREASFQAAEILLVPLKKGHEI